MLIVISDSDFRSDEGQLITQLFQNGLDLLHIRKYGADEKSLLKLIDQIDVEYHSKLVLHHDHEWGRRLGLKRFHYSEKDREEWKSQSWAGVKDQEIYSTSVHSLNEFNELPAHFDYAFISPVFDSISKADYKAGIFDLNERQHATAKLIALGGIQAENVTRVFQMGFDGAALLGAVWNSKNPGKTFSEIKNAAGTRRIASLQ